MSAWKADALPLGDARITVVDFTVPDAKKQDRFPGWRAL
jgi:hypothetical protein